MPWGCSSLGRALEWHSRGKGFDPPHLHHSIRTSCVAWFGFFLYICKNQGVRCLKADAFFILKAFAIAKYPAAVCGVMRVTHTRKACMAGISVSDRSKDRMAFHCGHR